MTPSIKEKVPGVPAVSCLGLQGRGLDRNVGFERNELQDAPGRPHDSVHGPLVLARGVGKLPKLDR
jgi:hypothetical protein